MSSPAATPTDDASEPPSGDPACPRLYRSDGAPPAPPQRAGPTPIGEARPVTPVKASANPLRIAVGVTTPSHSPRTVPFPDAIRSHPLFDTFFDLVDEDESHGGIATPAAPSTLASCHQLYQYISSTEHYAHAVHRAARQWIDDVRAAQAEAVAASPSSPVAKAAVKAAAAVASAKLAHASSDDDTAPSSPDSTDAHSDALVEAALGGDHFSGGFADTEPCSDDEWPPHASVMCIIH